jgi:hypothetical protein
VVADLHLTISTEIGGAYFAASMVHAVAPIDKGAAVIVGMHELVRKRQLCTRRTKMSGSEVTARCRVKRCCSTEASRRQTCAHARTCVLEVANVVLAEHNTAVLGSRLVETAANLFIAVPHHEKILFRLNLAAALLHVLHHELDKRRCTYRVTPGSWCQKAAPSPPAPSSPSAF